VLKLLLGGVLDRMIGFLAHNFFTQFESTGNHNAVAILHTFQFTVPQALGFSFLTSRVLATDLSVALQLQLTQEFREQGLREGL
jgi:hypothetical protein